MQIELLHVAMLGNSSFLLIVLTTEFVILAGIGLSTSNIVLLVFNVIPVCSQLTLLSVQLSKMVYGNLLLPIARNTGI
jgi:hypothetical protein